MLAVAGQASALWTSKCKQHLQQRTPLHRVLHLILNLMDQEMAVLVARCRRWVAGLYRQQTAELQQLGPAPACITGLVAVSYMNFHFHTAIAAPARSTCNEPPVLLWLLP